MGYQIIEINKHSWRIEDEHVRFFLLEGKEKALLVDSGLTIKNVVKIASALTDKPLYLINTHGDMDHTFGNREFKKYYISEADYINCKMAERFPDCKPIFVSDNEKIELGERTIRIISIPGHTYGSIALLDINYRLLFSGDSVQDGNIYMFGKHRDVNCFENSLLKLIDMNNQYDSIIPSHGGYCLSNDYALKVLNDWRRVKNGEILPIVEKLRLAEVWLYAGEYCGFYCDKD